ncbi:uncharacterized protein [Diadema setosum]|uniref:uncharacterized protein n=1 Tax=Diadema setosum TaxID=31175 RepID=UPI003B3B6F2D
MTEFLEQSAKLASNMFGQNIRKSAKPAVGSGPKKGPQRMTFTTQARNGQEIQIWALLDEGSDVSLCSNRLVKQLGIQGAPKDFQLTTVGNSLSNQKGLEVGLTVRNITDGKTINLPKVWTVKEMNISQDYAQLLIGGDPPEAFWVLDQHRSNPKEPCAVRTPLGWSLLGPTSSKSRSSSASVNFVRQEEDPLHSQLKQFWELDFGGYLQEEKTGMSIEDQRALKMMENTARKVGNHREVGLPWRYWPPEIPSNRYLAEVRLKYLKRKLEKDEALHERYTTTIGEYISSGYVEVKDESDHQSKSSDGGEKKFKEPKELKWYLPHHAVHASSQTGEALNDQLLQGPDVTNNLTGVLTRFRQERVAFVADVQGMFNQVKVPVKDRDAMTFLWWRDGDLSQEPTEYRMTIHLFDATSSPSCAGFALRKTAGDARGQFNKEVINTVLNNFYVDDCLKSVKCQDDAMSLVEDLRCLLAQGGFRLTKWLCNDRDVLASIPESERAESVLLEDLPAQRTLGILWDMETDSFKFEVQVKEKPATRRRVLSVASSLYEPLGFLAPFVLPAKVLQQNLCRQDLTWDAKISLEEEKQWQEWLNDLPLLTKIRIGRCLKPEGLQEIESAQLHHFCDASEVGYAAVSYLCLTDISDDGSQGLKASELLKDQRWITGPSFLTKEEKFWPTPPEVLEVARSDPEVKREIHVFPTSLRGSMQDLFTRHSSWNKLKRVMAWLLRYKRWLPTKAKGEGIGEMKSSLSAEELIEAEKDIKIMQRGVFGDYLDGMELKSCALKRLNPIIVDGIVQICGRLGNAPLDYDEKHPVILLHDHHVTRLLISHHHHLVGHSRAGMTWSFLRTRYWVMRGGVAVRKVVGKCFRCKRRNAPRMEQMMAELPLHRVTPDKPPFTYVGVDYFRPILVKQSCSRVKRRGKPEKIVNDNGTNFRGVERELRESLESLNQSKVNNYLLDQGINWSFNTPTASHMGGL